MNHQSNTVLDIGRSITDAADRAIRLGGAVRLGDDIVVVSDVAAVERASQDPKIAYLLSRAWTMTRADGRSAYLVIRHLRQWADGTPGGDE